MHDCESLEALNCVIFCTPDILVVLFIKNMGGQGIKLIPCSVGMPMNIVTGWLFVTAFCIALLKAAGFTLGLVGSKTDKVFTADEEIVLVLSLLVITPTFEGGPLETDGLFIP